MSIDLTRAPQEPSDDEEYEDTRTLELMADLASFESDEAERLAKIAAREERYRKHPELRPVIATSLGHTPRNGRHRASDGPEL